MTKYYLYKNDEDECFGCFDTKIAAVNTMNAYIKDVNQDVDVDDEDFVTPFDFHIKEKEVNELFSVVESKGYLGLPSDNKDLFELKKVGKVELKFLAEVKELVNEVNPRHLRALISLNKLFTIAEAWNKEDGFVPDWSNTRQIKYFPWFIYKESVAGFVFAYTYSAPSSAYAFIGSRLCFATRERAAQFGNNYVGLYNDVFLFEEEL